MDGKNYERIKCVGSIDSVWGGTTKTLIFHYHLFKNAGTSVDEILKANFGVRWQSQEFRVPPRINAAAVTEFLTSRTELDAVSSHTALLPLPKLEGVNIFPIIFLRHPIDRVRSAYEFERFQEADTLGARLARTSDLAGYLRELLKNKHHRQVRNFQTFRLARYEPAGRKSERDRAMRALDDLPFVGMVEDFDRSIERLERLLSPMFSDFRADRVHKNRSRKARSTLVERLLAVEDVLGAALYAELVEANSDDLAIYEKHRKRLEQESMS